MSSERCYRVIIDGLDRSDHFDYSSTGEHDKAKRSIHILAEDEHTIDDDILLKCKSDE